MTVLPLTEFQLVLFDPVRVTCMNEGPVKINDDVIMTSLWRHINVGYMILCVYLFFVRQ